MIDAAVGPAEEGDHLGHLAGLDEPLDRCPGEQDVVDDLALGDAVRLGLIGDLALDERGPDVAGQTVLLVTPFSAPSSAITLDRPSSPCLALT